MCHPVLISCRSCRGEGRIEYGHPNAPHADWVEYCDSCEGSGIEEIESEPATLEDLLNEDAEMEAA